MTAPKPEQIKFGGRLKLPRSDVVKMVAAALQCGAKSPRSKIAAARIVIATERDDLGKIPRPRSKDLATADKVIAKLFPDYSAVGKSIIREALSE